MRNITASLWLLFLVTLIGCCVYPGLMWCIGQTMFKHTANGSIISDTKGQKIGSQLLAQQFNNDEHFHSRPSAANYNAADSKSSTLAVSNYKLRDRAARALGPIVKYVDGKLVGPDVEMWFAADKFNAQKGIVAKWASTYPFLAKAWVDASAEHSAYVVKWAEQNPELVAQFTDANAKLLVPRVADLAVLFFQDFSRHNPGKFPLATNVDIQAIFFDMWLQDHKDVHLHAIEGDMVTASASGLDPHITLKNAMQQVDRVSTAWANKLQTDPRNVTQEIRKMLTDKSFAPLAGLAGDRIINVLEINLALHKKFDH